MDYKKIMRGSFGIVALIAFIAILALTLKAATYENMDFYQNSLDKSNVDVHIIDGKTVITIDKVFMQEDLMCTGSMEPIMGCGNIILSENINENETVNIGEIVVYVRNNDINDLVIHQVVDKVNDCYIMKGYNNFQLDMTCVKREDIIRRVVVIVPT